MMTAEELCNFDYWIARPAEAEWRAGLKQINHGDQQIFGLDDKWVSKAANRYRLLQKQEAAARMDKLYADRIDWCKMLSQRVAAGRDHSFIDKQIANINSEINKLSVSSRQLSKKMDLAAAKQVPIDNLFPVQPNGFFINNPLRPERSPSNSLRLDRKTNRWRDFATGEYGDILDLVMKAKKCDLKTAYKIIIG